MSMLTADKMYMGEIAEITFFNLEQLDAKRLRDMGLREGRLIELIHYDPLVSMKMILLIDGIRLAFPAALAPLIIVRPVRAHYQTLRDMAHYDKLTGCLNRHAANNIIQQEFDRFQNNKLPLTVMIADLDHFKKINDSYGHQTGDAVLEKFSETARATLRRNDLLCRWGGEEFLVLLRGTIMDEAMQIAERLRHSVAGLLISPFENSGSVTVSIGVAALPPHRSLERLLDDADKALYKAKNSGRNMVMAAC
jgi:diguanylate cyclase (GGDEF)-like protein